MSTLINLCRNCREDEAIALILSNKADIRFVDNNGDTALLWACYHKLTRVANILIKSLKSSPNHVNRNGDTALIIACRNRMTTTADLLIVYGHKTIDHFNNMNETALLYALSRDMPSIAEKLIKAGANCGHCNNRGYTALILACKNKKAHIALSLVEYNPGCIGADGNTALILACKHGMDDVALNLINTGFSEPGHINHANESAFWLACKIFNTPEIPRKILATGEVKLDHLNSSKFTPLIYACKMNWEKEALELISGSNLTTIDVLNRTALIWACENSMFKVALALLATNKSNPGQIDISGDTALAIAIRNNMPEKLILALISSDGVELENPDKNGDTPLISISDKYPQSVSITLIATGRSNPGYVNPITGDDALIIVTSNNMPRVALELVKTGKMNLNNINKNGKTAFMNAILNRMTDLLHEMIKYDIQVLHLTCKLNMTPLSMALQFVQLFPIAREIVKKNNYNPGLVDATGYTVLLRACYNELSDVAIAIIKSGDSSYNVVDPQGYTAFDIVVIKKLQEVAYEMVINGIVRIGQLYEAKPEWVPEELLCCSNPIEVTEVAI